MAKEKEDTGCALFPKCLECPFPLCIIGKVPQLLSRDRRLEAQGLKEKGLSNIQIAEVLGVSARQVSRYLT